MSNRKRRTGWTVPARLLPEGPYDPPREDVLVAFAEAVDEWSHLEEHLVRLYDVVADINDAKRSWIEFHRLGRAFDQRNIISEAAKGTTDKATAGKVEKLLRQVGDATTRRNRIVHGIWRTTMLDEEVEGGAATTRRSHLIFREWVQPGAPWGSDPRSDADVKALRDQGVRFYLEDLRALRDHFKDLSTRTMLLYLGIEIAKGIHLVRG
jgi:hypothetical protein